MKVAVLTTSYPRWEGDAAGAFVADTVRAARAGGVEVEVVSPASFPDFGLAYGHGISGNLKAAPWNSVRQSDVDSEATHLVNTLERPHKFRRTPAKGTFTQPIQQRMVAAFRNRQ